MCNIAGYAGNKQAAPILLEMLRRQAYYDGDMSTGIATIHEGKLHYRKVVGDVDALIAQTDVLELPGTIGIAHTRPGGGNPEKPFHPFISNDGQTALVTNGTTPATKYCSKWDETADFVVAAGYTLTHEMGNSKGRSPKLSHNGNHITPAELRVHLVDYYMKQGKTPTAALALTCAHLYSDNVTVTINENYPDSIFALRTTRPMAVVMSEGETYMATTRFGLPEGMGDAAIDLPLFYGCEITRKGIRISADRMDMEAVSEMTPHTYREGYRYLEEMLTSEKAPLYFDELEFALDARRDLWPGDHTCVQHARLVYDLLWQFDREGRLRRETRVQEVNNGSRHRYYMWLADK